MKEADGCSTSRRRAPRTRARRWNGRCVFFGVVSVLIVFLPLYAVLWGGTFAITHAMFLIVVGVFVVQLALRRRDRMPCTRPWDLQGLKLDRLWGAYLDRLHHLHYEAARIWSSRSTDTRRDRYLPRDRRRGERAAPLQVAAAARNLTSM